MGSVVSFLLSLAPDLVALFQELWTTSGGDVRKAQKLISDSREHYRSKHAVLVNRLDKLGKDLSDD